MKALTECVYILFCLFGASCALRLEEHHGNRHTYEIHLKKVDNNLDDEFGRRLHNARLTEHSSHFLKLNTVTASNIALKVSGANRLWTTYYGEIIIGNVEDERNKFKVLFDTGSSELWVPDELCQSEACLTRKRFDRNDGWKAKYDHGNYVPIIIKYLTGEMSAIDGNADVSLMNGVVVKNASVGLATKIDIPILMELPWDGIVGLGFTTEDQASRGSTSLLETLHQNSMLYPNFRNQFAYYISKTDGKMTFGGYNNEFKRRPADEFVWSQVMPNGSYWALNLLEITVQEPASRRLHNRKHQTRGRGITGLIASMSLDSPEYAMSSMGDTEKSIFIGKQKDLATTVSTSAKLSKDVNDGGNSTDEDPPMGNGHSTDKNAENNRQNLSDGEIIYRNSFDDTKIIVDTGTYLIYAPQNMRNFLDTLELNQCDDKHNLPTIIFTLEGIGTPGSEKVKLELTPDDYVIEFNDHEGKRRCTLGIVADDQQEELHLNAWTFGEIFLRAYYTVFDYDQRQIGFTPSRRTAP